MGIFFPLFFLQLDAEERNVDPTLALYSVSGVFSQFKYAHTKRQLTILNTVSITGRIIPSLPVVVHKIGVINTLLLCTLGSAILIFCFLAVKSVVGVVLFACAYGFFNGACECNRFKPLSGSNMIQIPILWLRHSQSWPRRTLKLERGWE